MQPIDNLCCHDLEGVKASFLLFFSLHPRSRASSIDMPFYLKVKTAEGQKNLKRTRKADCDVYVYT